MKKTISLLGLALVAFTDVAVASNVQFSTPATTAVVHYLPTPLCVAISKGDVETVKKFIEYGADVNETYNGMTPLMFAVRYNNVEIAKLLIDKGADVYAKDERGFTALQYAENSKYTQVADVIKASKKK